MTDSALRAIRLDHRLTAPLSTLLDLESGTALATTHGVASLTVSPWLVRPAARLLAHTAVRLRVVVGADGSLGTSKAEAASRALELGARDIEVGINGGMLLSGDEVGVLTELTGVVELAHSALAQAAVALPTGLPEAAIWRACLIAEQCGANRLVVRTDDQLTLIRAALSTHLELEAIADQLDAEGVRAAQAAGAVVVGAEFDAAVLEDLSPRPMAVAG